VRKSDKPMICSPADSAHPGDGFMACRAELLELPAGRHERPNRFELLTKERWFYFFIGGTVTEARHIPAKWNRTFVAVVHAHESDIPLRADERRCARRFVVLTEARSLIEATDAPPPPPRLTGAHTIGSHILNEGLVVLRLRPRSLVSKITCRDGHGPWRIRPVIGFCWSTPLP
jgi:hypothetical protein